MGDCDFHLCNFPCSKISIVNIDYFCKKKKKHLISVFSFSSLFKTRLPDIPTKEAPFLGFSLSGHGAVNPGLEHCSLRDLISPSLPVPNRSLSLLLWYHVSNLFLPLESQVKSVHFTAYIVIVPGCHSVTSMLLESSANVSHCPFSPSVTSATCLWHGLSKTLLVWPSLLKTLKMPPYLFLLLFRALFSTVLSGR